MNFNNCVLVGNLTRDPELKNLPSKKPVCNFALAINRKWTAEDGTKKERVLFIECSIFGKPAETFNQYMSKGNPVLIRGELMLDSWEDKAGVKRQKHWLLVETFQFLGKGDDGRDGR